MDQLTISIVDDAAPVRQAVDSLIRSIGHAVLTFDSAEAFLRSERLGDTDCLIADLRLPGASGLTLHDAVRAAGFRIPTVLMSAQLDERLSKQALNAGIIRCLRKPFTDEAVLQALSIALFLTGGRPRRVAALGPAAS